MNLREFLAQKLQTAICDAICEGLEPAKEWLCLKKPVPLMDQIYPDQDGFIFTCRALGINWRLLRKTLMGALEIGDCDQIRTALVPTLELVYNRDYETILDRKRTSET
jgi:hypothetical protein